MKLSICIITMLREHGLRRLLNSVNKQSFENVKKPDIEVIVVDNDTSGSAFKVVKEIRGDFIGDLKYVIEERKGIPFARNTSLKQVSDNSNFIIFIDDDEVPEPNWLEELIIAQKRFDADVISGPVIPYFIENPPRWIIKGGFFKRPRFRTGTKLSLAATNNTLIKKSVLNEMKIFFDESYANTGGSDTRFFMELNKRGYSIIWSDEAKVIEWIPKSRIRIKWIIQRGYREGNVFVRCKLDTYPEKKTLVKMFLKSILKICKYSFAILINIFGGKARFIHSLKKLSTSFGELCGIFNIKYNEYNTIHKV